MSVAEWTQLQEQLWSAFGPLLSWWLAFFMAGLVGCAAFLFGMMFFGEWINGG